MKSNFGRTDKIIRAILGVAIIGAKVKVGDSLWLTKVCDMVIGQQVKVVGTDSTTLIVEEILK